ncbi:MAG: magnesium/cobalt transporter CorA [Bacteroidales bacterium]
MAKTNRKRRSTRQLIGKRLEYAGKKSSLNDLQLIQYNSLDFSSKKYEATQELLNDCKEDRVKWIRVQGLSDVEDVEAIGKAFGLHYVEMQDILMPHHRVKVTERDNLVLAIVNQVSMDSNEEITIERMAIGFGNNFILTFQEGNNLYFEDIVNAIIENEGNLRDRNSDYLFCLFMNILLDRLGESLGVMEDGLNELELNLLDTLDPDGIKIEIQSYRKRYQSFKKSIAPLKESLIRLSKSENSLIHSNVKIYFSDIADRISSLSESLDYMREMISGLLDLYLSNNDLRMNEIMKRLTVVSTIFIPLTFMVGIWGMNFENIPELKFKYGYYIAWALMIFIAVGVWWYLKKRKWY